MPQVCWRPGHASSVVTAAASLRWGDSGDRRCPAPAHARLDLPAVQGCRPKAGYEKGARVARAVGKAALAAVNSCPASTDYGFPSGHATTTAAHAAALFLLDRRLSAVAAVCTLLEGFTRVYVGDHCPHYVLGAIVLAVPVALASSFVLRGLLRPLVVRLRACGALQPVLTAQPAAVR
ncbi:phosphatase PAP2 family protein [Streptomyces sp. NPDC002078]